MVLWALKGGGKDRSDGARLAGCEGIVILLPWEYIVIRTVIVIVIVSIVIIIIIIMIIIIITTFIITIIIAIRIVTITIILMIMMMMIISIGLMNCSTLLYFLLLLFPLLVS